MTDKIKIQEVVVVEGKDDTRRLREFFDVDTLKPLAQLLMKRYLSKSKKPKHYVG